MALTACNIIIYPCHLLRPQNVDFRSDTPPRLRYILFGISWPGNLPYPPFKVSKFIYAPWLLQNVVTKQIIIWGDVRRDSKA